MYLNSAIFCITVLVVWIVRRRRWQRMLWSYGIPGPEANFLSGHLNVLMDRKTAYTDLVQKYGKIFSVFFNGPRVVVADPELVRLIQVKDFHLFAMREMLFPAGGFDANPKYEVSVALGYLTPQRWKEQRALITTAFTSSKIKASVPLVNEAIEGLMLNLQQRENEPDFNVYDLFQRLTMDTIGRSAFGYHMNVQQNPDNEFFLATKKIFETFSKSWFSILSFVSLIFPEFFYVLYPIRMMMRVVLTWIGKPSHFTVQLNMCIKIMEERKHLKRRGEVVPDDFLQRMIDATLTVNEMNDMTEAKLAADDDVTKEGTDSRNGKLPLDRVKGRTHQMTDEEVAANASIMFDAGFETTSTLLGFLFHVLVNRQDIQDDVRREVQELLKEENRLDHNVLHSLTYLDSVIYETMRYFPPVNGFVTRTSTTDYKYKNIVIPKDTVVEIAVNLLHFDPETWEDPQTFDPLRFYGANKSRIQNPGYQAFGAGPRNCLGMRFAMLEAKLVVARFLSEYKVIPGPRTEAFDAIEIENKPITQNPKKGIFVHVTRV